MSASLTPREVEKIRNDLKEADAHTVNTEWRTARAEAAAKLAVALEHALAHVANVEDALDSGSHTVGTEPDPVVTAGHAYAALLRSKVTELRAEAANLEDKP